MEPINGFHASTTWLRLPFREKDSKKCPGTQLWLEWPQRTQRIKNGPISQGGARKDQAANLELNGGLEPPTC